MPERLQPDWGIEDLGLRARTYNALKWEGINCIEDLTRLRAQDLLAIRRMGADGLAHVEERLAEHGLRLATDDGAPDDDQPIEVVPPITVQGQDRTGRLVLLHLRADGTLHLDPEG